MHFAFGHDGAYRIKGSADTERCVVLQTEISVLRCRILPRDYEDGETLLGQPFHQGILGRKVENVVLHDPRRHDQDGFSVYLLCCWRILKEFDQPIAKNYFAWRDGDVVANLESFRAYWFFAAQNPPPVLPEVGGTPE